MMHRIFAEHLPPCKSVLDNGKFFEPGVFRSKKKDEVIVGDHRAQDPTFLSDFLARVESVYAGVISPANKGSEHWFNVPA